jgi:serine/threonine protein kinase
MAPELPVTRAATTASDVFAFGVLGWELATGDLPFDEASGPRSPRPWCSSRRAGTPRCAESALEELLLACLTSEPEQRPSAAEIVARLETAAHREAR